MSAAPAGAPPAADPSAPVDLERRFGGLARLYGVAGHAAIRSARVAVVGLGGVGSWAAEALARSGIGALTLIDLDQVAESNVNRQAQASSATLGMAKVEATAARIRDIHPGCTLTLVEDFVDAANWPALLQSPVDAVIDACDASAAKYAMAAWARREQGLPFVTVGAAGGKRAAQAVAVDDLSRVTHDPLLARLRQRLRRDEGIGADKALGVTCVYSAEPVTRPTRADSAAPQGLNCAGYGSVVAVTATFGFAAAGWVLQRLAAAGEARPAL